MRPPPRQAISAIILAGGQGRRMGRDKARLRWRGHRLLARWRELLQAECGEVLVVRARPRSAAGRHAAWDRQPGQGPVHGLEAGLRRARRAWCLVVPVDGLPPDPAVFACLARAGGGYLQRGADPCYLHALIPRRRRRALDGFLAAGGRSAANACATLGLRPVPIRATALPVCSLNTPQEWRHLQRRRA